MSVDARVPFSSSELDNVASVAVNNDFALLPDLHYETAGTFIVWHYRTTASNAIPLSQIQAKYYT